MVEDEARIVSLLGGASRTDRWQVAESTTVLALLGRCTIDLRDARTEVAGELWMSITSLLATVEVIVPEGTIVQPSGVALLGSATCKVPPHDSPGPLPTIEIDDVTVLGRLCIHTGPPMPRLRERLGRWLRSLARRRPAATPAPILAGAAPHGNDAIGGPESSATTTGLRPPLAVEGDGRPLDQVPAAPSRQPGPGGARRVQRNRPPTEPPAEALDDLDRVLADVLGERATPEGGPSA